METVLMNHKQVTSGSTTLCNSIDKRDLTIEYDLEKKLILLKPKNHSSLTELRKIFSNLVIKYGIDCDAQRNVEGYDTLFECSNMNYAAFIEEVVNKMANYESNKLTEIKTVLRVEDDAKFLLGEDVDGYYKLISTFNSEKYPENQTIRRIQLLRKEYDIPSDDCIKLHRETTINSNIANKNNITCEIKFSLLAKKPSDLAEHFSILSNSLSVLLS